MLTLSTKTRARLGVLAVTALAAGTALAHPGHPGSAMDASASMAAGFAHPFSGIDHLLAMLAVGLWAAQNKQRALWVLPLAFPLMMVAGALLAFAGLQVPAVETGIAASVAVLGLLIAFAVRMPLWGSTLVVSLFAMFHGYAHGAELPHGSSAAMYGAGFIAATALLHAAGLGIGLIAGQQMADRVVRIGGVGIAAVGAYLLAA
ncbi:HupE/UreJ family protein [Herbaspirillum seropedicae]|uniref:Urease accessory UreJ transmembrane protein n=2 Tax=Herbaspirillum seropedicae TaxID=964 RepID=D8IY69_HERSS|nr:HupE/UreJ family protein [Herbaspirillum seropedicae]ADJ66191.1 urease accessory UreJ transmembrane protein [Herbaspirillum seropedicae SmR1]AKN67946.1 urease accessory protein [Herbaspirillum seropedicae]AON57131.1 urease accessory UreJ transmembrane protein [Herbaspirillum seropedicae]NQE29979.1 urease accessory protein [Herbaspirillum seropedicae]UMU23986.1 HupE/UreJ family protein [Herbaspirillum seropedicae]